MCEWVDRYNDDPEKGTLELVQFFVRSSGCQATITMNNYRNKEAVDIIQELTKNFDEVLSKQMTNIYSYFEQSMYCMLCYVIKEYISIEALAQ